MIMTPRGNSVLRTVDELINPLTHSWDEQTLKDNFNPLDVSRILKIPLNEHMTEDFVAWHFSKTHTFTVAQPIIYNGGTVLAPILMVTIKELLIATLCGT